MTTNRKLEVFEELERIAKGNLKRAALYEELALLNEKEADECEKRAAEARENAAIHRAQADAARGD